MIKYTDARNSHVFLGLLVFKAVENDVEAPRQNALVLCRAGHCVRLAGVSHAVREQQRYATHHRYNEAIVDGRLRPSVQLAVSTPGLYHCAKFG